MGKNKNNIDILPIPKKCRYCGNDVILTSNAEIYGKEYGNGKCYLCRSCRAYVGVHTGTVIPLGTLADKNLRNLRNNAHMLFDKLWKGQTRKMTRYDAYRWLSNKMNIKIEETHIGWFDEEQCKKIINLLGDKTNDRNLERY